MQQNSQQKSKGQKLKTLSEKIGRTINSRGSTETSTASSSSTKQLMKSKKSSKKLLKPIKVCFIPYFEHHPYLDKLVTFVFKPLMLAVLYSGKSIMGWTMARWGMTYDMNSELVMQSIESAGKDKPFARMVALWSASIILGFVMIDTAYSRVFRKSLHEYMELCKFHKYDPWRKRE